MVRTFELSPHGTELTLPEGWKPFAVTSDRYGSPLLVARKWERVEG